jgi:hypothetical protein
MLLPPSSLLAQWTKDIVDVCRVSAAARAAMARQQKQWLYTGGPTGAQTIYNKLITHCDKLASVLFAPADLRFFVEYENDYGSEWGKRGQVAGRYLTREFMRRDIDLVFGQGVFEALPHGCYFAKVIYGHDGPVVKLRAPWAMGVYREDEPDLDQQEAICETALITEQELWRRLSHRPDGKELFKRARNYARRRSVTEEGDSYIHQIMLAGTAPVVGTPQAPTTGPGGFVQLTPSQSHAMLNPDVAVGLITVHELYIVNDETQDYTTIQIAEPDILLTPTMMRRNMFLPHDHPYVKICANPLVNYMWGRSELADLTKLQALLGDRLEDIKRIMSLQYDRIRAFIGFSGMNDERYDQLKNDGWIAEAMPGAKIDDLTPPMPANAFDEVGSIEQMFDAVAGFDNVLSGKGEPGVRAGNHFQGLMRTASPRLRDRAIRVERQLTELAEKILWLMAANDPRAHWTSADDPESKTDFYLSQLPDDARVLVDGHSSSPVYEQDHANTAAFALKAGAIGPDDLLDMLPLPNRDLLKEHLAARQAAQQKMLASLPPEERIALLTGRGGGRGAHH